MSSTKPDLTPAQQEEQRRIRTPGCGAGVLILLLATLAPSLSCVLASQVAVKYVDVPAVSAVSVNNAALQAEWPLAGEVVDNSAVILLAESYVVPGLGEITAGTHASDKHIEAESARAALSRPGTECHDCADGRKRCWTWGGPRGFFLGVYTVIKELWIETTAFSCDEDYLNDVLNDCDGTGGNPQPWW